MKKIILLFALLPIFITSCEQTKEAKAEKVIKKYFKETMDDYGSYSPVSFSEVTMAKTKWEVPKDLDPEIEKLVEVTEKINRSGYGKINVAADAAYHIQNINEYIERISNKKIGQVQFKRSKRMESIMA